MNGVQRSYFKTLTLVKGNWNESYNPKKSEHSILHKFTKWMHNNDSGKSASNGVALGALAGGLGTGLATGKAGYGVAGALGGAALAWGASSWCSIIRNKFEHMNKIIAYMDSDPQWTALQLNS